MASWSSSPSSSADIKASVEDWIMARSAMHRSMDEDEPTLRALFDMNKSGDLISEEYSRTVSSHSQSSESGQGKNRDY